MIGFLRVLGLMNAAVWFGALVFFHFGVETAFASPQMRELIGTNNFPYFSPAVANLVASRFFALYFICSVIALIHLMAEWLYFGKYPPRRWLTLILALVLVGALRGFWIQPVQKALHELEYGRQSRPEQREAAGRALRTWTRISHVIDIALLGGLAVYIWRVGNPADSMRFVSASKFRS